MKNLFILSVALVLVLMAGCATAPKCPTCPSENAIIMVGPGIPVVVPKGYFDNPENWLTEQQYKDAIKKQSGL